MSKKSKEQPAVENPGPQKLSNQEYERELFKLQVELVKLQDWVKHTGARIVVIFEGRDAAGKGGVIKRIMERVSPRVFRLIALPAPTEREKTQLYWQRYIAQLPAAGEIILFDRSWYNRAGVEHVMGFCSKEEYKRFLVGCPPFEATLVNNGVILLKYWMDVSETEQHRRFQARIKDPSKRWKLSPMDLESNRRWYDYSRARDAMFAATDTDWAPWYVASTDDKKRGRLDVISHLLSQVPYKPLAPRDVKLPRRQPRGGYVESDRPRRLVPDLF
jgi:polyphosphate kinase 2